MVRVLNMGDSYQLNYPAVTIVPGLVAVLVITVIARAVTGRCAQDGVGDSALPVGLQGENP